jgi:hypothetical protein
MKSTKRIILLIAVSFFINTSYAQVSNADSMIHKIFAALKAKDEKAFVALYPNAKQFGSFMRTMMEKMMKSEQMQQMMAADEKSKNMNIDSLITTEVDKLTSPEGFAKMEKEFAKTYQNIIEKGENKGVNWPDATLTSFTIDSAAGLGDELQMLGDVGFKAMKGVIDFRSAGKDYHMNFDKIMFIPSEGGWYGGEFPQLGLKSESLDEIIDEPQPDSVAVTPKAKTKTKSKTKTSSTKTKTKTKTPARKPTTKS